MLYRLLRNNKESGPFTASQLREMGLKPYDLLWTEGRGAAWQYASEITELKDFAPVVEEQPFDRFFKRKEALQTAQQPAVAAKKVKPRFRISNGQLIMVEPGNMEVASAGIIKETQVRTQKETVTVKQVNTASDWQDEYAKWQPQPQKKVITIEEPVEVETKYSESLDDLKKRYAEKVLNEKSAGLSSSVSSASVKQNIMAAVALIVLAVGGYIGYTLKQKDNVKAEGNSIVERADVSNGNIMSSQPADNNTADVSKPDNKASHTAAQPVSNIKNDEAKAVKTVGEKITPKTTVQAIAENNKPALPATQKMAMAATAKTSVAPAKITGKTTAINDTKKDPVKASGNLASNTASKTNVSSLPAVTKPVATTNVPAQIDTKPLAVKQNAPKKIDDYLSVKKLGGSTSGVQNVRLLVNNVTDFPIDLAVIDIQYFDSKGKYQKGETMYVKNIDGGNNVELRVPDSDKSSSIKYKVSLVSSEKKTLYLVAD